jgi:hypothetical protein
MQRKLFEKLAIRRWILRIANSLVILFLLAVTGFIGYAIRLRSSAQELIAATARIQSTADAEDLIATWRGRGRRYSESASADGLDHTYQVEIENHFLSVFRLMPTVVLTGRLVTHMGNLQASFLVMYTGDEPCCESGVWIQEDFSSGRSARFSNSSPTFYVDRRVDEKNRPWKLTVEFTQEASVNQKQQAFSLNPNCLVLPRSCRSAADILPTIWHRDPQ